MIHFSGDRSLGSGAAGSLRCMQVSVHGSVSHAVFSAAYEGDSPIFTAGPVALLGILPCGPRKLGQSPVNGYFPAGSRRPAPTGAGDGNDDFGGGILLRAASSFARSPAISSSRSSIFASSAAQYFTGSRR